MFQRLPKQRVFLHSHVAASGVVLPTNVTYELPAVHDYFKLQLYILQGPGHVSLITRPSAWNPAVERLVPLRSSMILGSTLWVDTWHLERGLSPFS